MKHFRVTSRKADYQVIVGRGAWRALRPFPLEPYSSVFVFTERALWKRWGNLFVAETGLRSKTRQRWTAERKSRPNAHSLRTLFVPSGETSKCLTMVERLAGELLKQGADRQSLLVAMGGGVVGDLGGFLASTYMRGIDYINVPTTLVAQMDSAIGGKTAVNVGAMKNLVGTFYPPRLVLADPFVLRSMSARSFRSGLYEVVKHAILQGPALFRQLETHLDALTAANTAALEPVLERAARVKVDVVTRDEREAELRLVLNLGHTFGHAFEEATGYARFTHGEAVGWGLLAATRLADRLSLLDSAEAARIDRLVRRVGTLPPVRDLDPARILDLLPQDKKAVAGKIRWVLPERIGKVRIVTGVPEAQVARALQDVQTA